MKTLQSQKKKTEGGEKRRSEKILEQKKKKKWGKGRREREVIVEKKKDEMKRTLKHGRHFGHVPF